MDSANVFTMLIFPIKVSFLHFQMFKTFSILRNLSAFSVLYEKKTPSAQIGSYGQPKLKGVSCLSFQLPSHKASVLEVLTCKPEIDLNFSSMFSKCWIETVSLTKTVVWSAYILVFISFFPIVIPLISLSLLIALARSSRPITNNRRDNGQPCLTPRSREKKCEACPWFKTQLEISVGEFWTIVKS